jgi:CDP-diglyceride synthetase
VLKRIATAIVLIPLVLVLILRAPVPVLAVVAGIVALLTIHEFLKLTESYGVRPLWVLTYIFTGILFALLAFNFGNEKPLLSTAVFVYCLGFAAAIAPFIFLTRAMKKEDLSSGYPAAAASVFAFTYIALPMGMLVQLRQQWAGPFICCTCCWWFGREIFLLILSASR